MIVAGKALFIGWALVIPMLVYPWWAVCGDLRRARTCSLSVVLTTTFQLAHCVDATDVVSVVPGGRRRRPACWLGRAPGPDDGQLLVPVARFLTWYLGGLNYQVEHHLFPKVCPTSTTPALSPVVERNCLRHGVRYTVQPSLRLALRSHSRHLRELGRAGLPAELEMG